MLTFVAVICAPQAPSRPLPDLAPAGAAVVSWAELVDPGPAGRGLTDPQLPVVLLDPWPGADPERLLTEVAGALASLEAVNLPIEPGTGSEAVIATTRPVTDTLKVVGAGGTLVATADRDDHRFVTTPIAVRLWMLREICEDLPVSGPTSSIAVLRALAGRGATVVGT